MKRILFILPVFMLLTAFSLRADVIYAPYTTFATVWSFEAIGSYELPLTGSTTFNPWIGLGLVSSFRDWRFPATGLEAAVEIKQYFARDRFKGFNLGLYAGIAGMRYPEFYQAQLVDHAITIGFVPGLKLAYKVKLNSWLFLEPYSGVSVPVYKEKHHSGSGLVPNNRGLIFTFGLRFGYNRVRK